MTIIRSGRKQNPDSHCGRLREFFKQNPDEELSHRDIEAKLGITSSTLYNVLRILKRDGICETVLTVRAVKK